MAHISTITRDREVQYRFNDLVAAIRQADRLPDPFDRATAALMGGRWTESQARELIALIRQGAATITPDSYAVRIAPVGGSDRRTVLLFDPAGLPVPNQERCSVDCDADGGRVTVTLFVDGKSVKLAEGLTFEEQRLRDVLG